MAIIARPGPFFCVFGVKKIRTFYFKLTEQSSRKKLAAGGFEPEKVQPPYPAPQKNANLWGCANRIVNGRAVCDSHHINKDVLYATYHAAVKAMIEDAGALLEVIQTETEVEMQPRNKAAMDEVEQQIIELQERVPDLHKQKRAMKISDAYYNAQVNDYSRQLGALESRKQALQTADARYATVRMWLADFRQHMQEGDATDDRDGSIMKTLVEAIIVWDDRIEVRFKCGATVEQKYVA